MGKASNSNRWKRFRLRNNKLTRKTQNLMKKAGEERKKKEGKGFVKTQKGRKGKLD